MTHLISERKHWAKTIPRYVVTNPKSACKEIISLPEKILRQRKENVKENKLLAAEYVYVQAASANRFTSLCVALYQDLHPFRV